MRFTSFLGEHGKTQYQMRAQTADLPDVQIGVVVLGDWESRHVNVGQVRSFRIIFVGRMRAMVAVRVLQNAVCYAVANS